MSIAVMLSIAILLRKCLGKPSHMRLCCCCSRAVFPSVPLGRVWQPGGREPAECAGGGFGPL
jgi:hypothetical protein